MNPAQGGWLIFVSMLLAMVLAVAHLPTFLPTWTGWLRPAWVISVVFFWVIHSPQRLGLVSVWLLGCALDLLRAEPLGLNGLMLAGVTFVGWQFYERIRMFSTPQRAVVLFLLVLAAELGRAALMTLVADVPWSFGVPAVALASALCWPLVYGVMTWVTQAIRVD
ncbi:MAG: rod shape-determining protein MreD [Pseudomonadota bacterium]